VTKDGDPVPADVRALTESLGLGPPGGKISHLHQAPGLHELFWLARQLELVDLRRTGLVAGPALAAWHNDDALTTRSDIEVLDFWRQVFALIETGQQVPQDAVTSDNAPLSGIVTVTQRCVPGMMVSLYHAAALDTDQQVAALIRPHVKELLGRRPADLWGRGRGRGGRRCCPRRAVPAARSADRTRSPGDLRAWTGRAGQRRQAHGA
jgi:hypothetical protein